MRYYVNAATNFGRVQIIGNTADFIALHARDYYQRQEGCHFVWGGIRVKVNSEPPLVSLDRVRELFDMLEGEWWEARERGDQFAMNRVTPPMAVCHYLMQGANSVGWPVWLARYVDTPDEVPPDMAESYMISYAQQYEPQGENHA